MDAASGDWRDAAQCLLVMQRVVSSDALDGEFGDGVVDGHKIEVGCWWKEEDGWMV